MKLYVSPNPHIRSGDTTQKIMLKVIIALVPSLAAGVIIFGYRAALVTAVTVACCVLFEYIFRFIAKTDGSKSDLSAVVTGLLLAFNLPSNLPLYMAVTGAFIAIVIVKMLFGGIGRNFANPAITARIALMLGFTAAMTNYPLPVAYRTAAAVTGSTPLQVIEAGGFSVPPDVIKDMLFGLHGGVLGETCGIAVILGGIYLVAAKVISPATPVAYIGTVAVFAALFGINPAYWVLSGGLLLGAVFMATDYSTAPVTTRGKIIFGIGCGIITSVVRNYASMAEGVSFSILIMNILTPHIDTLDIKLGGLKKNET